MSEVTRKGVKGIKNQVTSSHKPSPLSNFHIKHAEQMDAMKAGDFSEAELEQTKAMLINQLLESVDVARE